MDEMVNLVEELVINKVRIEKLKHELSDNTQAKILDQELRIISEIQASIQKVRLVQIKAIAGAITELVQQCGREYGNPAGLLIEGQETELESSLIQYVHGFITYCVRDAFESDFKGRSDGFNQIRISAASDGKTFTAVIESNGKGLNCEALDVSAYSAEEAKKFFSMEGVTHDCGQAMKLWSELRRLEAHMTVEGTADKFRRVTLSVPLSSSIMQGILVTVGDQDYAIPLDFIETIISAKTVAVQGSHNHGMILHMDHAVELIKLSELLGIHSVETASSILIVKAENRRAALLVDSVLDQTDMVIKPSHSILADIPVIKGATILGDGLVTLVLDIPSILRGI